MIVLLFEIEEIERKVGEQMGQLAMVQRGSMTAKAPVDAVPQQQQHKYY